MEQCRSAQAWLRGADTSVAREEYNRYRRQGKYELAGAVKAVATGAIWTRQMKHGAQYATSSNCTRRSAQVPETLQHWAYQCEGNHAVAELAEHQEIRLQANANWSQAPLVYGRGLIPRGLLPEIEVNEDPHVVNEGPPFGDWTRVQGDAGRITVFGDASMTASLPTPLRRVGCAIVQCPMMTRHVIAKHGEVLTGPRQEVGRGELWALQWQPQAGTPKSTPKLRKP